MKKGLYFISLTVITIFLVIGIFNGNESEYKSLPIMELGCSYSFDTTDLTRVFGDADYVFLAKVECEVGTEYRNIELNDEGNVFFAEPYTTYNVKIEKNIKNVLEGNILIQKYGGISYYEEYILVLENDFLPEVGQKYIFSVYTQPDGTLLVCGNNSNILVNYNFFNREKTLQSFKDIENNSVETKRERYEIAEAKVLLKGR